MPLYYAGLLITGCAQQTFTVQNKPAAVAPKETITHHFFVSTKLGRRKLVIEICGGAENVLNKQQTFVMDCSVLYFRHLYIAEAMLCIAHNNYMSYPSIWATLSALLVYTSGFLPVVFA